jgi:hypothetical protein
MTRILVLRLASPLWRLRRATAIETGLFKAQARYLLRHKKKTARVACPPSGTMRPPEQIGTWAQSSLTIPFRPLRVRTLATLSRQL